MILIYTLMIYIYQEGFARNSSEKSMGRSSMCLRVGFIDIFHPWLGFFLIFFRAYGIPNMNRK
jgi:hypothetical protein